MGKNIEQQSATSRLQKSEPGIVLKFLASVPADDENGEPEVKAVPLTDAELLEWASAEVLKEKEEFGELPKRIFSCYQRKGEKGWRLICILIDGI